MTSRESSLHFSLERGLGIALQARQEKKALTSRGRGLLRGFLELRRPWGFSHEARRGSQGASRAAPCGTTHVGSLEIPREAGLILRCARKAGNPFQATQGNRLSRRDQEGRRGSDEVLLGPSVFPSREPGVSGNFWGSHEGCQVSNFRTEHGTSLETP